MYYITFNMKEGGNRHPAIADPAVREAIDYAMDTEQIVDVALLGHGIICPTNWACGPNYAGELNPDLEVTPFDLEQTNAILDEAGYLDSDGDGIRETEDGQPLQFRFYFEQEVPGNLTISELASEWLSQIGIAAEVEAVESSTMHAAVYQDRGFDMALIYYGTDIDPAAIDLEFSCWSSEAGGLNDSGYCNEEMDNLVYDYWYASDSEAGWDAMWQAQEIINRERPRILLAGENHIQAYRNDRFDFPEDTCVTGSGMWNFPAVLDIVTK